MHFFTEALCKNEQLDYYQRWSHI